jgi:hypothetical protein
LAPFRATYGISGAQRVREQIDTGYTPNVKVRRRDPLNKQK